MNGINRSLCILLAFGAILLSACTKDKKPPVAVADSLAIPYTIRKTWPHDVKSFTEGLVVHNGDLYESTGNFKQSWIGIVDVPSGKPDKKIVLEDQYFGEGITILNNKIYQLTYKSKIGFIYDLKTYKRLGSFPFNNAEGWGLTHNNEHLIMSDGSADLTFLDTVTMKPVKTLRVTDEAGAVEKINELEYVNGFIYANVWETATILRIDANTGKVMGRIDLSQTLYDVKLINPSADVLNGIAYHEESKALLVTGKYWPFLFALQLKK
jgi:glutaminyl-peptide cyclotransferase